MSKRILRIRQGEPLLDIVSYGRGGPRENGRRLTSEQVERIRRTVRRVPEVMVKVLPRASNDLTAAGKHLDYIGRYGELGTETDDGEHRTGRSDRTLLEEWDLDIDDVRRQAAMVAVSNRKPAKLIHKLMFSMPAGTPPEKVRLAVRNFAREEFWGQHRYAFTLHTDEDHPHVHLVLKAVSEQGVRLNIRKATLRHWRAQFALNLRRLGVPANATERAVRGRSQKAMKDGIYRASLRGDSIHVRSKVESVAAELLKKNTHVNAGRRTMIATRAAVEDGWRAAADLLSEAGYRDLAEEVRRFVKEMPPASTERERIAAELLHAVGARRIHERVR